jgi:multidrug efflux pump subunit AcrA (membrane-fusion protein)
VIVRVDDPFVSSDGRPALTPGMFVDVAIEGRTLRDVVKVPRSAVHEGPSVWRFDDGRLRITPVEVRRADREWTYVSSGLSDGALVITSTMEAVTDGMLVRRFNGSADGDQLPGQDLTPSVESAP